MRGKPATSARSPIWSARRTSPTRSRKASPSSASPSRTSSASISRSSPYLLALLSAVPRLLSFPLPRFEAGEGVGAAERRRRVRVVQVRCLPDPHPSHRFAMAPYPLPFQSTGEGRKDVAPLHHGSEALFPFPSAPNRGSPYEHRPFRQDRH